MKPSLTKEYFLKEAQAKGIEVDKCDLDTFRINAFEAVLAPIIVSDDEFEEDDLFKKGVCVAADLICLKGEGNNPPSGFYISEFILESEESVRLAFKDIETGRHLSYEMVFSAERGFHTEGEPTVDREFDVFVFQQYTKWCGKWHGTNRKWRVCTGKDCTDGIICIVWERKWV